MKRTKKERKELRAVKWDHAAEVYEYCQKSGIEIHSFGDIDTAATPHLRIERAVDYWPASRRFYDLEWGTRGFGFEELMNHLLARASEKR